VLNQCWTWSGFPIATRSVIQNRINIGLDFENISTESDMDIQTALITAVECLIRGFFGYKPDWIKQLDSATGLGLDWITHWKYWTGLGSQKSSIRSTQLGIGQHINLSLICQAVLNMIRFPDRDPTGFCISEPDRIGFRKKLNRIRYGYPNCFDHCSKILDHSFFRILTGLDQIFGQIFRIRIGIFNENFGLD